VERSPFFFLKNDDLFFAAVFWQCSGLWRFLHFSKTVRKKAARQILWQGSGLLSCPPPPPPPVF
jgi:hypothetical protein